MCCTSCYKIQCAAHIYCPCAGAVEHRRLVASSFRLATILGIGQGVALGGHRRQALLVSSARDKELEPLLPVIPWRSSETQEWRPCSRMDGSEDTSQKW